MSVVVGGGRFKSVIDREFELDDVAKAHKYMETNESTGKIVIRVQELE